MDEKKEDRLIECIEDVKNYIKTVDRNFLEQAPTEWVEVLIRALRKCAINIQDYKKFREGLIQLAALVLVVMEYSDHLFRDYLSKPAPPKLKMPEDIRRSLFPPKQ